MSGGNTPMKKKGDTRGISYVMISTSAILRFHASTQANFSFDFDLRVFNLRRILECGIVYNVKII